MSTTQISKESLRLLRNDIDTALESVARKHGISLRTGNATYTGTTATFKLNVALIVDGKIATKEQSNLKELYQLLGLREKHLTQEFIMGRKRFVLDGYKNSSRTSRPFIIRCIADGKAYVTSKEALFKTLGLDKS